MFLLFLWASNSLIYNLKNVDRDGDQLNDNMEALIGSDPLDVDTDDDGMNDYYECYYWINRSEGEITPDFFNYWANYWNETFNIILTYDLLRTHLLPTGDVDQDNLSNIRDIDSDGDGAFDYPEILSDRDPALPDDSNSSNNNQNNNGGGGGGGSGGGGGGAGDLDPTEIHIVTVFPKDIYKNNTFYVDGYVIGQNQQDLFNLTVEVFVNKTKDSNGSFAGRGTIDNNGYFNISCIVPEDVEVGSNHIVGHFLGDDENSESWSDPTVNIYSDTKLKLDMLNSVGMNYPFEIKGYLTDTGDIPIDNEIIEIFWDNIFIGNTTTNSEGKFVLDYIYNQLGRYQIDAFFEGSKYLNNSNDSKIIKVKDFGTYLNVSLSKNTIKREEKLNIKGALFSSNNIPIPDAELKIYYNSEEVSTKDTQTNGSFEDEITIPADSPLGEVYLNVIFAGSELYGAADFQEIIIVRSDTIISLDPLEKETYQRNETIIISGILTDNYDKPIKNTTLTIVLDDNITYLDTDNQGKFDRDYKIPITIAYGIHYITVNFSGLDYYLSSEKTTTYEVVEGGLLNNNILIIIFIVILLGIGGVILSLLKKQQDVKVDKISLKEVALKSISKLRNENDMRKAILECYSDMCKWLDASGLKKDIDKTPREFAADIKKELDVSDECLVSLTKIFEKACYSNYEIDIQERDKTIECLDEILTSLTDNISTPVVEEQNGIEGK